MNDSEADKKADKFEVVDRGEATGLMEPLLIPQGSHHRPGLTDLAVELAAKAAGFRRSLPSGIHSALSDLVRAMNCYYSNLIEGHNTHPIDIERAMKADFSTDNAKRNLQQEALAHVQVQTWIDRGGLALRAITMQGIRETHERFCGLLPEELLWVEGLEGGERVKLEPGAFRTTDVQVGHHVAISPGAIGRFLSRFEEGYGNLGKTDQILAAAPAHHRLLWIHPFLDGNGRVARLISHAMLLDSLDSGGIWSIARGMARNETRYKQHLASCDLERRGDLDGRGARSEEALAQFTKFFLETCLDQIHFMERLVQPDKLRARILSWAEEENRSGDLPAKAGMVLEAILYRGELPRGEVPALLGYGDRQARRVIAALIERGVVVSASPRASLKLNFPARLALRWMPGLFPEEP